MKNQEEVLKERSANLTRDIAAGKASVTLLSGQVMPIKDYLIMMQKPRYIPTKNLTDAQRTGLYNPETKPTSDELDRYPANS